MTVPVLRKPFPEESTKRKRPGPVQLLPLAALGLLCLWVLGVENGAMAFFGQAEWLPEQLRPLLNSFLIMIGTVPILYLLACRPLLRLVNEFQRADRCLREELAAVADTAEEREADLEEVTQELQEEVASRKKRGEELQQQADRFRSLIENSLDGIALLDAAGLTLYVSPATSKILGLAPEQLIGRNIFERIHRDNHEDVRDHLAWLREKDHDIKTAQLRMIRGDGSWRWIEAVGCNLLSEPSVRAIVVNWRDITERRQAEEALQASEGRYRELASNIPGVIYQMLLRLDGSLSLPFVSDGLYALLGVSPQDVQEDVSVLLGRVHEDDLHVVYKSIGQSAANMETAVAEVRMRHENGDIIWVRAVASPHSQPDGSVLWNGVTLDVTERKRAEEELQESEEKFRMLAGAAQDAVITLDSDARVSFWNRAAEAIFGYPRGEAVGSYIGDLVISDSRYTDAPRELMAFLSGKNLEGPVGKIHEFPGKRKDGTQFPAEVSFSMMETKSGWNGIAIMRDITQRKRGKGALLESERKIRDLASQSVKAQEEELQWVADWVHDRVAQDLVAVYQQLQVLKSLVPAAPEAQRVVSRVLEMQQKTISEVRAIMKDLYSPALDVFGLIPVIEEELRHFQDDSGCRAILRSDYELRPPKYIESSLYRIFHEAMANIRRHCSESREVEVSLISRPEGVSLQVKDDGPGFDVESAVLGKGSGGLSTMRRRAEIIGGTFGISSGQGLGTTLTVDIPGKYVSHPEDDRL